jgi:DNA repair protein RadC
MSRRRKAVPDGRESESETRELREAASASEEGRFRPTLELPRPLRPREKLLTRGPRALTQCELLSVVLGPGNRREPAREVADRLVRRHGLDGLAGLSARAWRRERGLGSAAAARLSAVFELGRRAYGREGEEQRPTVSGPRQAFRHVRHLTRVRKEHLIGLYLDAQNGLLGRETISIGSLNTTRTHPREILYPAVAHLALGFILAHNHPSGCLEPSPEDVEFTRSVRRAGELMGIELYDHLIVARAGYTSFRERGLL